jgi:hypothetical protein
MLAEGLSDMKSFSKITKSLTGTKTPPIGMLIDPLMGRVTDSVDQVAKVLLDKHLPGWTPNAGSASMHQRPQSI